MPLSSTSPRVPVGANAVRIASGVFGVVFLVLVLTQLMTLSGPARLPLAAAAGISALVCLGLRWASPVMGARGHERVLVTLCVVPLVDVFLAITLTGEIELTAVLMLVVVGIGSITVRLRQPVALITASYVAWLLLVTWIRPAPAATVVHYGLQLLLAGVLAAVVFWVRATNSRELARASGNLAAQVDELAAARVERERALERYRSLFRDGPVGNSLTDGHGLFAEINPAVELLLGRPADQILGRSPLAFTHPDDVGLNTGAAALMAASADGIGRLEVRFVRPGGEIRWGSVCVTRVDGPGESPWALAHVEDITERKKMELDLVRSRDAMAATAEIATALQRDEDPRPVAIAHLQRLVRASDVTVIEPVDQRNLVVTASARPELVGVRISLDERSGTTHVWESGEPLFISDLATSPLVHRGLLRITSATSMMWQPVGLPGSLDAVLALGWGDTVSEVGAVERELVGALAAELSAALIGERMRRSLEQRTKLDPLTGLLNRRGWDHEIAQLVDQSRRTGQPFVLAVADLDHFKQFNDEFGHLEGDILLSGFADQAKKAVREVDLVARWGGEEFALALRNCDLSDAAPVLERVRNAVPGDCTCSIGFATYEAGETVTECMRRVDAALYRAKESGRNRLEYGVSGPSSIARPAPRPAVPR